MTKYGIDPVRSQPALQTTASYVALDDITIIVNMTTRVFELYDYAKLFPGFFISLMGVGCKNFLGASLQTTFFLLFWESSDYSPNTFSPLNI